MSETPHALLWFRQDLRLSDNPALVEAAQHDHPIIPVYILDDDNAGDWKMGAASRVWLYHSLTKLNESLDNKLRFFEGDASDILPELIKRYNIRAVYWNRCYEPWRVKRDKAIKTALEGDGINVQNFNASLLHEPWTVLKDDDTPYRVFTPFYKNTCRKKGDPPAPMPKPETIKLHCGLEIGCKLDEFGLRPKGLNWSEAMMDHWTAGEDGAKKQLAHFLDHGLDGYKDGRNYPVKDNVSRLSPHLHFGEISPHQIWHATKNAIEKDGMENDGENFLSEIGWREFSYTQLYYNPELMTTPLMKKFKAFPWNKDDTALSRWQRGETGYPIVDAGMRELWATGYMHNRIRMVAASFLIKHLLIHWRHGEEWFWDCLVDADLANNAASWQWVAGCGADASPYFRIFNPIKQGQDYDPDGAYVRQWIPELASLPDKYIHCPWEASQDILGEAGVTLGEDYPKPIVDHREARERALAAYEDIK